MHKIFIMYLFNYEGLLFDFFGTDTVDLYRIVCFYLGTDYNFQEFYKLFE